MENKDLFNDLTSAIQKIDDLVELASKTNSTYVAIQLLEIKGEILNHLIRLPYDAK